MGNWDQLLPDLLTMIVKKVDLYEDFVAFGGVCKSWRSVAVKGNFNGHPSTQLPWLMLAEDPTDSSSSRVFVNLSKGGMVRKHELPEARGKWCIESMGWLVTIDEAGAMELLHPLTRATISLPHLKTYSLFEQETGEDSLTPLSGYVARAALSASPSGDKDYVLVLIMGIHSELVFWKPGDEVWNRVGGTQFPGHLDVIYHNKDNKFYAVDAFGGIRSAAVCSSSSSATLETVGHVPGGVDSELIIEGQLSIVECGGVLHLVKKVLHLSKEEYKTSGFIVLKAVGDDDSNNTSFTKWKEVNDLGGRSVFVGNNTAICVHSPDAGGVKANCIYFTDDYHDGYSTIGGAIGGGGKDMGIYNMETGTIEPFYRGAPSLSKYCPPIWVSPSF